MRRGIEKRATPGVVGVDGSLDEQLGGEGTRGGGLSRSPRTAEEVGMAGGSESRGQGEGGARLVPGRLGEGRGNRKSPGNGFRHARTPRTSARTAAWTASRSPPAWTTRTRSGWSRATSS